MKAARARDSDHPTGAQLRAARGLLNLSVLELSERTGLAPNTIKRAEGTNGPSPITRANAKLLIAILTELGVVFVPADETADAGVRLRHGVDVQLSRKRRAI